MTTRREVPFTGDNLAWVHNEIGEIKSRLSLVQQSAEQSRALAMEAADRSSQARNKVEEYDGYSIAIEHLQDDVHALHELIARAEDDIHSLRQTRQETERRMLAESDRVRQERNEIGQRFGDLERMIEGWHDRASSYEEHNRRNLEYASLLAQRVEAIESGQGELDTLQSRSQSTISRIDNEVQRLSATLNALEREDMVQVERSNSAFEMLRRVEGEIEAVKAETNRISRLDDRLELVQAERTRHNERLNELTAEQNKMGERINEQGERLTLIEVRMGSYQEELKALRGQLQNDRETITGYLHSLSELEADMRKRSIIALEKEIRDLRGRAINFSEE